MGRNYVDPRQTRIDSLDAYIQTLWTWRTFLGSDTHANVIWIDSLDIQSHDYVDSRQTPMDSLDAV